MHPMFAFLGSLFIYLAVILSLIVFIVQWKFNQKKNLVNQNQMELLLTISGLLWMAFIFLVYNFVILDYSLEAVYAFADNSMTVLERIMASWAGRQGVMLLWATVMSTITTASYFYLRDIEDNEIKQRLFTVLFFFNFLIISFILSTRPPPFATHIATGNGLGLTPSLLSFWMQIHPPIAFLAYSSFIFPYAYAIALLSFHSEDITVSKKIHWLNDFNILIGWFMTTLFIIAGSIWGYEENWSGFWAWDPVEMASLIMWGSATLYFHVKSQVSDNHVLRKATAGLGWVSVAFASFIVRSGLLSGLHSYVGGAQLYVFGTLLLGSLGGLMYAISKSGSDILPDYLFSWSKHNSKPKLLTFWTLVFFIGANTLGIIMQIFNVLILEIDEIPYEYYIAINGICLVVLGLLLVLCEINYEHYEGKQLATIFGGVTLIAIVFYYLNNIDGFVSIFIISVLTGAAVLLLANMVTVLYKSNNIRKFSIQLSHLLVVLLIITYTTVDYNTQAVNRSFNAGEEVEIASYGIKLNATHEFEDNQYMVKIDVFRDGTYFDTVILKHGMHNNQFWTSGDWIILPTYDLHFRSVIQGLPGIISQQTPIEIVIYKVPFANYFRIMFVLFTFTSIVSISSSYRRRPRVKS